MNTFLTGQTRPVNEKWNNNETFQLDEMEQQLRMSNKNDE